jgi:asparagine synthase (glutamine-hydrolysing)
MCGIAGMVAFEGRRISPDAIDRLTAELKHRGPDGHGRWFSDDGSIALGHRRLSILDPSPGGAQPMTSHDGRYVIAYNGEIYNFLEIAAELRSLGHAMNTGSDTEVILLAYATWGKGMLHRFNGMWAFAIVDTMRQTVFLSRDRFGVKPLYYYTDAECLVFASEIDAIHSLIPGRVTPDPRFFERLHEFDLSSYSSANTHLREVKSLQAGFNLRVSGGLVESTKWYQRERVDVPAKFPDQVQRFRELLVDACRLRLRSDVPVATCLSGGVDSSSIVSLLGREKSGDGARTTHFTHKSFTAAFPGHELDESSDARLVASAAGMDFDSYIVEPPSLRELEEALAACDGPMPSPAFFPIWKLYRHIRESGVSVTIDGQGADEMMGGYYLAYPAMRGAWQSRKFLWMRDVARTYAGLHPEADNWVKGDWSNWRRVTGSEIDQAVKRPLKRLLASVSLYDRDKISSTAGHEGDIRSGDNELAVALHNQFVSAPLPFLLHQYDRASMTSGVECRMPFMDYRLVEFVFSLPLDSLIGHGFTKRILRESMRGLMPERVRTNRRKTGFNAPFAAWFTGERKTWMMDQLSSVTSTHDCLPDHDNIKRMLEVESAESEERKIWPAVHSAWWLASVSERSNRNTPLFAS